MTKKKDDKKNVKLYKIIIFEFDMHIFKIIISLFLFSNVDYCSFHFNFNFLTN